MRMECARTNTQGFVCHYFLPISLHQPKPTSDKSQALNSVLLRFLSVFEKCKLIQGGITSHLSDGLPSMGSQSRTRLKQLSSSIQTTQGNRLSCRDQEGRRGSEPRAAFPSGCLAAQPKRWAEGIRAPQAPRRSFLTVHGSATAPLTSRPPSTVTAAWVRTESDMTEAT